VLAHLDNFGGWAKLLGMTTPISASWYTLASLHGRGTRVRPGSLAGLAAARRENLGAFYTPPEVAAIAWAAVRPYLDAVAATGRRAQLLDTSIGTGRLLQWANPEAHAITGCDVDPEPLEALGAALKAAGFDFELRQAGMEVVQAAGFDVALINPPFSLTLSSPVMAYNAACAYGPYGPGTQALSHRYALQQGLAAARVVAAILPRTFAETLPGEDGAERLAALLHLPTGAFEGEGTEVATSIAVYGSVKHRSDLQSIVLRRGQPIPRLALNLGAPATCTRTRFVVDGVDHSEPAITRPVTGDASVRIVHSGRKLCLQFQCGLVEAKVLNALMRHRLQPIEGLRRPAGWIYAGQGVYDLEAYLVQPDPVGALRAVANQIREAGGAPKYAPGLLEHLKRRARRVRREKTPFRLEVASAFAEVGRVQAKPRRRMQIDPDRWGSAVLRPSEVVEFERQGSQWVHVNASGERLVLEDAALAAAFNVQDKASDGPGYRVVHAGREEAFPALARHIRAEMARQGVSPVVSWGYQASDLVELRMGRGGVAAWEMGLGKTRLAIALCLMGGRHNLIAVEAHLVPEFMDELKATGLPEDSWQVIESPADTEALRRINLIAYTRLRRPLHAGHRKTYAQALRRRISTLVADEAHLLRSPDTAQTRALWALCPRRRYGLTGTPVPSYPRDLLYLLRWAGGDGTALQPYGLARAFMEPAVLSGLGRLERGVDVFRDRHVVLEWVTHEFEDGLTRGGKREVPKLANPDLYRAWAAPLVKRRTRGEPDVRRHIAMPEVEHRLIECDFDPAHRAQFLGVADEFAQWWRDRRTADGADARRVNMVSLLAHIGAVERATNAPQMDIGQWGRLAGATSKQRLAGERAIAWAERGRKVIVFAQSPTCLNAIAGVISAKTGERPVMVTGERDIETRTEEINARFRRGSCPYLLATYGAAQTGLNLPEGSVVIRASRAWTHKTEEQAAARVMRPQQRERVVIEDLELRGSIDPYQRQMTAMKAAAAASGIDHLDADDEAEFEHLQTIIDRFVEAVEAETGLKRQQLRERNAA
jgi:superfamily II DNA or RNA helicase